MAENTTGRPSAASLPPEAIELATRMYDAARAGQMDIFQQALPVGLPANMTNEKGDSLVGFDLPYSDQSIVSPTRTILASSGDAIFELLICL